MVNTTFAGNYYIQSVCVGMNGISIDRAYNTKFLGVMINDKLNWKEHIKIIQSKQLIVLISKGSFTIVNIFSIFLGLQIDQHLKIVR